MAYFARSKKFSNGKNRGKPYIQRGKGDFAKIFVSLIIPQNSAKVKRKEKKI